MLGLSILVFSVLLAAPPTVSNLRGLSSNSTQPTYRTASNTKAPATRMPVSTTPVQRYTPTRTAQRPTALRTAQLPPTPGLPPQPQPLKAPPLPLDLAPPPADPYDAPQLAPPPGLVPPPPAMEPDAGYRSPVVAEPMGMPPGPEPLPPPGPAEFVDSGFVSGCPNCPGCPCDDDDDGCCLCGPQNPCDMYPHYAYYPQYHGHYYFRPYNYTHIFQHQEWAVSVGMDPRNPYSNKIFCVAMAGFEQRYRPENAPIGSALPVGNGLPQLEELLNPKTQP